MERSLTTNPTFFGDVARQMELGPRVEELLRTPRRELRVQVPIERDDGTVVSFRGFLVQHDSSRGPMKGGVRCTRNLSGADVGELASLMTWKNALLNLPFGGSACGIAVEPRLLSLHEWERLIRAFVHRIHDVIGPQRDVYGPDMNTGGQVMAWMMDEYSKLHGHTPAVVTGKPIELYGTHGHRAAGGRGVALVTASVLAQDGTQLEGTSVAVQGFGQVGRAAALALFQKGAKIVAVSDSRGGIFRADGLHIPSLIEHKSGTGRVAGFPGADSLTQSDLLALDVNVLLPAATGGVLHRGNAQDVRARWVIEAANAPVTVEADAALRERGVTVVPDILANGGGAAVSYLEWVQNQQQHRWSEERVLSELDTLLNTAVQTVLEVSRNKQVPLRTAAYMVAVGRVGRATVLRGL